MIACMHCKELFEKGGLVKGALMHSLEHEFVVFCGTWCCEQWMKVNKNKNRMTLNRPTRRRK